MNHEEIKRITKNRLHRLGLIRQANAHFEQMNAAQIQKVLDFMRSREDLMDTSPLMDETATSQTKE